MNEDIFNQEGINNLKQELENLKTNARTDGQALEIRYSNGRFV